MSGSTPHLALSCRPVSDLKPNPRNARTHSRRQIRQIADSIRAFGFLNPILLDDAGIVCFGTQSGSRQMGKPNY
jgi:hypothetical protein